MLVRRPVTTTNKNNELHTHQRVVVTIHSNDDNPNFIIYICSTTKGKNRSRLEINFRNIFRTIEAVAAKKMPYIPGMWKKQLISGFDDDRLHKDNSKILFLEDRFTTKQSHSTAAHGRQISCMDLASANAAHKDSQAGRGRTGRQAGLCVRIESARQPPNVVGLWLVAHFDATLPHGVVAYNSNQFFESDQWFGRCSLWVASVYASFLFLTGRHRLCLCQSLSLSLSLCFAYAVAGNPSADMTRHTRTPCMAHPVSLIIW